MKAIVGSAIRRVAHGLAALVKPSSPNWEWRFDPYAVESYSQEGEDLILRRVFDRQSTGFYVDVGAHHPTRFSNTYYFYRRGWRGINIDATPGSMKAFDKLRPKDTNIEAFVSTQKQEVEFLLFNDGALNGGSKNSCQVPKNGAYRKVGSCGLTGRRLDEILERHLPAAQKIDFISIDVEGYDLEVLLSNNWERYRPSYVLVEEYGSLTIEGVCGRQSCKWLRQQGYQLFAKTANTLIFKLEDHAWQTDKRVTPAMNGSR